MSARAYGNQPPSGSDCQVTLEERRVTRTLPQMIAVEGNTETSMTSLTNADVDAINSPGAMISTSVLQRYAEIMNTVRQHPDTVWMGPETAASLTRNAEGTKNTFTAKMARATRVIILLYIPDKIHFAMCLVRQQKPVEIRDTGGENSVNDAITLAQAVLTKMRSLEKKWGPELDQEKWIKHETRKQTFNGNDCAALAVINAHMALTTPGEQANPEHAVQYRRHLAESVMHKEG